MLVLASGSPRRRRMLEEAGFVFEVLSPDVDETPPPGLAPRDVAVELAARKARAVRRDEDCVLAADTLLDVGGTILGKPDDAEDAARILRMISGRYHSVFTGVAVVRGGALRTGVAQTDVAFRALTDAEIRAYVATGEPFGKAGAYAIQGRAASFVEAIDGPLDNVIGLPMDLVRRLLRASGYAVP